MIIWLDDDSDITLMPFIDALEILGGYELTHLNNPDDFFDFLNRTHPEEITAFIIDIMMPTGQNVFTNTRESEVGSLTGLVLLKRLQEDEKYKKIPKLIFSITDREAVNQWADQNKIRRLKKQRTSTVNLVDEVNDLTGRNKHA